MTKNSQNQINSEQTKAKTDQPEHTDTHTHTISVNGNVS